MEREETSERLIKKLRQCGHFLYYRMGDKAGQRRIFFALLERKEILQHELQEILGVRSGSLSEIVGKMEADGLIEKGRSETDGRNFVLRLTERGRLLAERSREEYAGKVALATSCLSAAEQEELLKLLEKLTARWERLETDGEFCSVSPDPKAER